MNYDQVEGASLEYFNGNALAAANFARKYAKRKGKEFLESTPDEMHRRLALEFARIDKQYDPDADTYELYFNLLSRFKKVVPQGSPMMGIGSGLNVSLSNCFVIDSPKDSISDIFRAAEEIAQIEKRRGGVGVDLSLLRPTGALVNNAALSSGGIPCFSDFYSYITRMIGQHGRQGALMLTLDIRHPDAVENFIMMKTDLTKVSNANVSLLINDDFMDAVVKGNMFTHQ